MTLSHRTDAVRAALAALVLVSTLIATGASASPDARASAEIDQLLGDIANSGCTFIRSGKEYTGQEARRHIAFKYGFVRSRIDSADQFIRDLASTSSTTGEAYHIRCASAQTDARPWLETRLKAARGQR
ncbi:MAG: DUF5329 family protein [Betaproteobacteria bacterium]